MAEAHIRFVPALACRLILRLLHQWISIHAGLFRFHSSHFAVGTTFCERSRANLLAPAYEDGWWRFGAHRFLWLRHDYACRSAAVAMDDWTSESDLQRISSVCTSHEQMGIAMVRRCRSCGIVCKSLLLCGRLSLTTTLGLRFCTLWLVVQIYLRRPGSSNSPPQER
jgi:hypothetical protein